MNEVTRHGKHWLLTTQLCISIKYKRFEKVERFYRSKREAEAQLARHMRMLAEAKFDIEALEVYRRREVEAYLVKRLDRDMGQLFRG